MESSTQWRLKVLIQVVTHVCVCRWWYMRGWGLYYNHTSENPDTCESREYPSQITQQKEIPNQMFQTVRSLPWVFPCLLLLLSPEGCWNHKPCLISANIAYLVRPTRQLIFSVWFLCSHSNLVTLAAQDFTLQPLEKKPKNSTHTSLRENEGFPKEAPPHKES